MADIDHSKLIVAHYAIAEATGADMMNASIMLRDNIQNGTEKNAMSEVPAEYKPDWAALKAAADANPGFGAAHELAYQKSQKHYKALCELWAVKDYAGMVKLMQS